MERVSTTWSPSNWNCKTCAMHVLKTCLWNLNMKNQLLHWCSGISHFISKTIIVPCYNEKEILYATNRKIFLFFFEYFWVLSWDKIKVYFKMQLGAEFLSKKFHFNFKQLFFFPLGQSYMKCHPRDDPIELKKGWLPHFLFCSEDGWQCRFNSGILILGCKIYSISLF